MKRYVPSGGEPKALRGAWINDTEPADDTPSVSDTKTVWESHAQSQGIDTDGMTKDEIIDAVGE